MDSTDMTLAYYDERALDFIGGTVGVEFAALQNEFASRVVAGGRILDLGCGSGRDSRAFIERGFEVVAVDGSEEMCRHASEYIGKDVICSRFQDFEPEGSFDGIWACASLLHLAPGDIVTVMGRLAAHLRSDGCLYASFKYGDFAGYRDGRYFTDLDERSLRSLLEYVPDLTVQDEFVTKDVRPGRSEERWLNAFLSKSEACEREKPAKLDPLAQPMGSPRHANDRAIVKGRDTAARLSYEERGSAFSLMFRV